MRKIGSARMFLMIMDVRIQENRTGKSRQEKGHNDNRCCGGADVNHFCALFL